MPLCAASLQISWEAKSDVGGRASFKSRQSASPKKVSDEEIRAGKFAQLCYVKNLGLYLRHDSPAERRYAGRLSPRVSAPKGTSSKPIANAMEVSATGIPSEP